MMGSKQDKVRELLEQVERAVHEIQASIDYSDELSDEDLRQTVLDYMFDCRGYLWECINIMKRKGFNIRG